MPKKFSSKEKISITIDKDILNTVETAIQSGKFRNRSHALEYSLIKLLEGEQDGRS